MTSNKTVKKTYNKSRELAGSSLFEGLTRFGYAVRGLIYLVIGGLSLQFAFGSGSPANFSQAIMFISRNGQIKFIAVILIVGLIGYSMWGFVRAVFDPYKKGNDIAGLLNRFGYLVSALSYGLLVIPALKIYQGSFSGSSFTGTKQLSAELLLKPYGNLVLGLIGLGYMIGAAGQVYLAYGNSFAGDFRQDRIKGSKKNLIIFSGKTGIIARSVVLGLVGWFLIISALALNSGKAKDINDVLNYLKFVSPYGNYILAVLSLGIILFGLYSVTGAIWIRYPLGEKQDWIQSAV